MIHHVKHLGIFSQRHNDLDLSSNDYQKKHIGFFSHRHNDLDLSSNDYQKKIIFKLSTEEMLMTQVQKSSHANDPRRTKHDPTVTLWKPARDKAQMSQLAANSPLYQHEARPRVVS